MFLPSLGYGHIVVIMYLLLQCILSYQYFNRNIQKLENEI